MNEDIYNETVEQTVIGLILNGEISIIKALGELSDKCFTRYITKAVWSVLSASNKVLSVSEIETECLKNGIKVKASEIAKLKVLAIGADQKTMIASLFEFYRKRELYKVIQAEYSNILDVTSDSREIANKLIIASSKVTEIVEMETKKSPEIYDTIAEIRNKMDGKDSPVMSTYLTALDVPLSGGWEKGTLNIVAARQGCGKTALTTWILHKNAHAGKKVGFVSMEMTRKQLNRRELSMLTGIYYGKMKDATRLTDEEYNRIANAGFTWEQSHFIREYCGVVDIDRLRLIINKMVYQDGCEYIVIDYLQRMSIRTGAGQNTAFSISQICSEIKAMATQHDVGIILLSQLNRSNEKEKVRIPKITDLRDSGGIEEVADTVTLLHRFDIYESEPHDENGVSLKNKMLVISAKNRDGEPDFGNYILCNMGTNQYFNEDQQHEWIQSFHQNPNTQHGNAPY